MYLENTNNDLISILDNNCRRKWKINAFWILLSKEVIDEDEEELGVIKEKRKDESKFKKENKHFLSKVRIFF